MVKTEPDVKPKVKTKPKIELNKEHKPNIKLKYDVKMIRTKPDTNKITYEEKRLL